MRSTLVLALAASLVAAGATACRGCKGCEDDAREEQEERDRLRDEFWRVHLVVTGEGRVVTERGELACVRDATGTRGACGPVLLRYKELEAPLLHALPAPGWRFDHWVSLRRPPDGAPGHADPLPDSEYYVNRFGYADTGETEEVTAVFAAPSRRPSDAARASP